MKKNKIYIYISFLVLILFVLTACPDLLNQSDINNITNGVIRIKIGEENQSSRTIQPGQDAIAGYQLTFNPNRAPVNITTSNYADVSLADGTWIITATAYKKGGTLGNSADAIASGSIEITINDGVVSETIPVIILQPLGSGDGTLNYEITIDAASHAIGVEGTFTLWQLNGFLFYDFGNNGVLSFTSSVSENFSLPTGSYIAETRLTRTSDNMIALRREVIEIWPETVNTFKFAPLEYYNPNAVLANSNALLSETATKINNNSIGTGTGSGIDEQNPKIYGFKTANAANLSIELVFENNSLFSSYSWVINSGTAPNGVYPNNNQIPGSIDLSNDKVLWIKAVSEDTNKIIYYKFIITYPSPPNNGSFTDLDYSTGSIRGTISWTRPSDLDGIFSYRIYFGTDESTKWSASPIHTTSTAFEESFFLGNTSLPAGVKYFLIYSRSETNDYPDCLAVPIYDLAMNPQSAGSFIVTGTNPSSNSGISYESPNLIINQSGTYYITGTGSETSDRIRIENSWNSPNITANIVLRDVNINVSTENNAVAFDINAGTYNNINVNLILEGTNTLRSGNAQAGLKVPLNGTLIISGTGTLNAHGGQNNGSGIGGGSSDSAYGAIKINSGTINATGNWGGAGIGGNNNNGNSKEIIINGGIINATGAAGGSIATFQQAGAGIGGSHNGSGGIITINGGTVTATGGRARNNDNYSGRAGIGGGGTDSIINITGGTITATSNSANDGAAGIGGSYNQSGGTINISGGTITALGNAAGIGSGDRGSNSVINISGGIITASGRSGAGIGDGSFGGNSTISISDGTINAISYGWHDGNQWVFGAGIGGGYNSVGGTINITGGVITTSVREGDIADGIGNGSGNSRDKQLSINNAIIFASKLTEVIELNDSIIFTVNDGIMYGNVVLDQNTIIPAGYKLTINNGNNLYTAGYTLTNNGVILIENGEIIGNVTGNQPVRPALIISGDSDYTYSDGILAINGNGSYTIGMRSGVASSYADRIVVSPGVTADITLMNVNIDVSNINNISAFDMTGATVNLTIIGDNFLKSGDFQAGLMVPDNATLVITEVSIGSLTASSVGRGDGIGRSFNGTSGSINILGGTVIATTNVYAGISGTNINISGGTVIATTISSSYSGISGSNISISGGTVIAAVSSSGNSNISGTNISISGGLISANNITGTINNINGNAVLLASSIGATLPTDENLGPAIIFNGNSGTMYGDVEFQQDVIFTEGRILTIFGGQNLTIPNGITLTNNGTINVIGTIVGNIEGNQPVMTGLIVTGDSNYTYTEGVFTINGDGSYNIGMRNGVNRTDDRISIASGVTADITISDVNIYYLWGAFSMANNATVNLTLIGENFFRAGADYNSGVRLDSTATLNITNASTGSLRASGLYGISGGKINLFGGTLTAIHLWSGHVSIAGLSSVVINNISGNAILFASSMYETTLPTGNNLGPAIIFNGNSGTMYGDVELQQDVTFDTGSVLTIPDERSLTIPNGITLTNNGTINNNGTIYRNGVIAGTGSITGNQPQ